jgi:hypothetical protein
MEGITIMPLTRGSRSNRQSALPPDEFQIVHEAKESTWDQMMGLFLTPSNQNPANNKLKQNKYAIRRPLHVATCESRFSNNEKPDTQVVTREQPDDLLDYVFENVESIVCRGEAETEIKSKGNTLVGMSIPSLRRNNSLIDLDDEEEDMSMDGNPRKPIDGDELFVSISTGEIVRISKQGKLKRTTMKGNPDPLDYFFQNTESFVCGESITPEQMMMCPDEDDGIIGACSFRDQDPEPLAYRARSFREDDEIIGACSFRDQDPEPPAYTTFSELPRQTKEVVESPKVKDEQKNKADMVDYVLENTESFVCGASTGPHDIKLGGGKQEGAEHGLVGACCKFYNSEENEEDSVDTESVVCGASARPHDIKHGGKQEEEEHGFVGACCNEYDSVDTNDDHLVAQAQARYYEDTSEAENAELVGMVVAPAYELNRDISVISTYSAGAVSQASTAAIGNVTEAQKFGHKKKSRNLLGGVFGRRREKR